MNVEPPRSRPRPSRAATTAIVVIALAIAAWIVASSQLFAIQRVEVRGNARLSHDDVVRLARVRLGANLLMLSLDDVERSLLRSPWVSSADANRSLPSTLVIAVAERAPVARVSDPGGEALVAADGTVLVRAPAGSVGVPSVGTVREALAIGERLPGFAVSLRVAASMPRRLRALVEEAVVESGEVVLVLDGGATARYGRPEALAAKHAALRSMLDFARDRGIEIEYVDVRVPAAPALKPVGSAG